MISPDFHTSLPYTKKSHDMYPSQIHILVGGGPLFCVSLWSTKAVNLTPSNHVTQKPGSESRQVLLKLMRSTYTTQCYAFQPLSHERIMISQSYPIQTCTTSIV